jgi:hypothetical protein
MKKIILAALFALTLNVATAQQRDPAYVETISKRVDGNMSKLDITDPAAAEKVKEIIVNHYYTINDLDTERDSLRKAGAAPEFIAANKEAKLYRHHFSFIAELSMYLTDEQITGVKDALTYGVVDITYRVYLEQNPTLNDFQKRRVYTWLCEARELAISGGSSNEKHAVFGKYKGKINNFFSAEKKAGRL